MFQKYLLELPPELNAGEAVDGEVDEAVEDGAELDNVVKDDCGVTGYVAVPLCLRKGGAVSRKGVRRADSLPDTLQRWRVWRTPAGRG